MFDVIVVPISEERREAFAAAAARLRFRMEFALAGRVASPMTYDGYPIPGSQPYVNGAPRFAEDPRTIAVMQARVDRLEEATTEYREARPTA